MCDDDEEEDVLSSSMQIKPTSYFDNDEKYPCWHACLKTGDCRKEYRWMVGCKHQGQLDEYVFNISKVGDVDNDEVWNRITGLDFAIKLISLFRSGGTNKLRKWIKNGCKE